MLAYLHPRFLFRRPSASALIKAQRMRAEQAYFEHTAAAETHAMMARAYKARLSRLTQVENEMQTGAPVELVDPISVFNGG